MRRVEPLLKIRLPFHYLSVEGFPYGLFFVLCALALLELHMTSRGASAREQRKGGGCTEEVGIHV